MRFGGRGFGERRFGGPRFDRGFDRGRDEPKPIKVGEEYDVEIKETGSKGDGIARINNFVVFVNGTKIGDKVHIKITDVRNRFAIGEKTSTAESPTEVSEEKEETEVESQSEEKPEEEGEEETSEEKSEEE